MGPLSDQFDRIVGERWDWARQFDHSVPFDGAKFCAARWVAANRSVRMLTTKRVKDFNDLVMP